MSTAAAAPEGITAWFQRRFSNPDRSETDSLGRILLTIGIAAVGLGLLLQLLFRYQSVGSTYRLLIWKLSVGSFGAGGPVGFAGLIVLTWPDVRRRYLAAALVGALGAVALYLVTYPGLWDPGSNEGVSQLGFWVYTASIGILLVLAAWLVIRRWDESRFVQSDPTSRSAGEAADDEPEAEDRIDRLDTRADQLLMEVDSLESEPEAEELGRIESLIQRIAEQVEELTTDVDDVSGRLDALETKLETVESRLARIDDEQGREIDEIGARLRRLEAARSDRSGRFAGNRPMTAGVPSSGSGARTRTASSGHHRSIARTDRHRRREGSDSRQSTRRSGRSDARYASARSLTATRNPPTGPLGYSEEFWLKVGLAFIGFITIVITGLLFSVS